MSMDTLSFLQKKYVDTDADYLQNIWKQTDALGGIIGYLIG